MGSKHIYLGKMLLDKRLFCNTIKRKFELYGVRCYTRGTENIMNVFDRKAKRLQRDRSTTLPNFAESQFIKEEVKTLHIHQCSWSFSLFGDIYLPLTCKINCVNMKHNYVNNNIPFIFILVASFWKCLFELLHACQSVS